MCISQKLRLGFYIKPYLVSMNYCYMEVGMGYWWEHIFSTAVKVSPLDLEWSSELFSRADWCEWFCWAAYQRLSGRALGPGFYPTTGKWLIAESSWNQTGSGAGCTLPYRKALQGWTLRTWEGKQRTLYIRRWTILGGFYLFHILLWQSWRLLSGTGRQQRGEWPWTVTGRYFVANVIYSGLLLSSC